jgi:hypothetical protein
MTIRVALLLAGPAFGPDASLERTKTPAPLRFEAMKK